MADGLFTETGYFYVMPKVALRPLAEIFRASVLKMLKDEGRLDDSLLKKILTWRHNSGFSVHNGVRLQARDAKGLENVAQYTIRNTFSLAKLSYIEKMGTVIYRSKMSHGGNKRNFEMLTPIEFIAAITQHIPERLAQMVRYYGWYSNRMRGDRQRAELLQGAEKTEEQTSEVIVISDFRTKKIPPLVWCECIKKSPGGRSASLQSLWWIDEGEFHPRTPGYQANSVSSRLIARGKAKTWPSTSKEMFGSSC